MYWTSSIEKKTTVSGYDTDTWHEEYNEILGFNKPKLKILIDNWNWHWSKVTYVHNDRQTREKYPRMRDRLDNVAKDYRHKHDSYKPRTETDTPETDSYVRHDKTWQEPLERD